MKQIRLFKSEPDNDMKSTMWMPVILTEKQKTIVLILNARVFQ